MKISKYAVLLSAILAFVFTISGILFISIGLFYQNYRAEYTSDYLLGAGTVLLVLALLFIAGILSVKNHLRRARRLLMVGCLLFVLTAMWPVWQIINTLTLASAQLYILIFTLILFIPFIWLFYYLWKLGKITL